MSAKTTAEILRAQVAAAQAAPPSPLGVIPFWHNDPVSWDNVFLGGEVLPGSVNRIEGAKSSRKIDVKKAPGRSGATLTDQGYQPAEFTIVCVITSENELFGWENLTAKLRPRGGESPKAFDIVHPQLLLLGISACYVKTVYQLERKDKDLQEGKIDVIEFLPLASKANGKVKKATNFKIADTATIGTTSKEASRGTSAKVYAPSKTETPPNL